MAKRAKDISLVLYIGLHKTGTSYVQNLFSAGRYDLLREGVLYPNTGALDTLTNNTRDGAQSGHAMFTRMGPIRRRLTAEVLAEIPESASTILLSSENFTLWHRTATPEQQIEKFAAFKDISVVLVLRRQDDWIESYYKQIVDGHRDFETRSFAEFLQQDGSVLLDFHRRFTPWRDLVGPEHFHVMSYDDLPDASAIARGILGVAGVDAGLLDHLMSMPLPRYDSVRAIDTLGLRILNSYRFESREDRTRIARAIYGIAPVGGLELLTSPMREGIQVACKPVNERIELEWFDEPVPGFRFGAPREPVAVEPPSTTDLLEYVDRVIALCEAVGARDSALQVEDPVAVEGDSGAGA